MGMEEPERLRRPVIHPAFTHALMDETCEHPLANQADPGRRDDFVSCHPAESGRAGGLSGAVRRGCRLAAVGQALQLLPRQLHQDASRGRQMNIPAGDEGEGLLQRRG
jgi:hypothetical protein